MTADHTAQLEELMALLDGELSADAADRVRAHVTSCAECQRLSGELGLVSERLQAWNPGVAPVTLQPKQQPHWSHRRTLAAAAAIVVVAGAGALVLQPRSEPSMDVAAVWAPESAIHATPPPTPPSPAVGVAASAKRLTVAPLPLGATQSAGAEQVATGPLITRTASLSLVVRDYDAGRAELERIARAVNGFIGNLVASDARGSAPSLTATLRVPSTRLDEALAALKRLGSVQHERQGSDDVTQQSADLNARLVNARASESRLSDILKNRTGRLSDVLDVEREIARVRGEIEQMEAERKNLHNRIDYATVQIEMTTERRAEGVVGPVSISTRLRNAVVDGYAAAIERAISLAVFAAEVLPTVILWLVMIGPPAWLIRRWNLRRAD